MELFFLNYSSELNMKKCLTDAFNALKSQINATAKLKTISKISRWNVAELIYKPSPSEIALSQINMLSKANQIELTTHTTLHNFSRQMKTYFSSSSLDGPDQEKIKAFFKGLDDLLQFEVKNLSTIFENNKALVGHDLMPITKGEELKYFILEVSRFDYDLRLALIATQALVKTIFNGLEQYYPLISQDKSSVKTVQTQLTNLSEICGLIESSDTEYAQCKRRVRHHIQAAKNNELINQQYQNLMSETKKTQQKKTEKKQIPGEQENQLQLELIGENKAGFAAMAFDLALQQIRDKQSHLEDKAKTNSNYRDAHAITANLYMDLRQLRDDFFSGKIKDAQTFRAHYTSLIETAREQLAVHRGPKKYVALTLRCLNAALGESCFPFFKAPKTDSEVKLDKLLQDLNQIDIPEPEQNAFFNYQG